MDSTEFIGTGTGCATPPCVQPLWALLSLPCLGASVIVGRGQAPHTEAVGSLGALGLGSTQRNEPLCRAGAGAILNGE